MGRTNKLKTAMTTTLRPPDLSRLLSLRAEHGLSSQAITAAAPRFNRIAQRHENGTAPRAVSSFQLFQTPASLASRMVELAGDRASLCVLEPSAGLGRILDALAPMNPAEVVAVELAQPCADELRRRDGLRVVQRDFLTVEPAELGQFDCIVMNPPFKRGSDIKHILHACTFLMAESILVAICADGPKQNAMLKPLAETWIPLPARSFSEANTGVDTVLLTIRKHAKDARHFRP